MRKRQKVDEDETTSAKDTTTTTPNTNTANESATPAGSNKLPNYRLKYTLVGHKKSLSSVKFSPDGKFLASACKAKRAKNHYNKVHAHFVFGDLVDG